MIAADPLDAAFLHLVHHGKSGGLGCFVADLPGPLPRGTAVVVASVRGLEAGKVAGPGSQRHARLLGPALAGRLLRQFTHDDGQVWLRQQRLAYDIFERASSVARKLQLPLALLDVDVLFDGSQAILQFLGAEDAGIETLAKALNGAFATGLSFENLNVAATNVAADEHGGCGKPDCGKVSGGGSCSTCSTGGCSSCSTHKDGVDLKVYFEHLRGKMEAQQRVPLL